MSVPEHLAIDIPDSVLGLPQQQFVHLRCQSGSGAACARCIRPLSRPTALRHVKNGTLPNCPAHKRKPHAGYKHLLDCLDKVIDYDVIAHQVPVFSQVRGKGMWGRKSTTGRFAKGRDGAIDVVVVPLVCRGGAWVAVEVDGPEHERADAAKADAKRACSAETNSELQLVRLQVTHQQTWLHDLTLCHRNSNIV